MFKRWLALGSFIASSLWIYFWEWIRSQLYERAQHMLAPYFEWLTWDQLGRYGPPAIFVVIGLCLFWWTRPNKAISGDGHSTENSGTGLAVQPVSQPYLKEAHVNAGTLTSSPEIFPNVVVCFGRSGRDADVCVDFNYFVAGFWLPRRRLLLKNIPSFRRDERIAITIISRDIAENGLIWRWGDSQVKYPNKPEGILVKNKHYQCRIAFIFADETEEYAYFIAETDVGADSMPMVIDGHMFAFVRQWEAE
jgi:hypothetical protein